MGTEVETYGTWQDAAAPATDWFDDADGPELGGRETWTASLPELKICKLVFYCLNFSF